MDADDDIDASSDSSDFYSTEPAAPSDAQPQAQTAPDANVVDSTAPAVLPGSNGDPVADSPDAQEDAIATRDGDDQDSSSEMDLSDESRPPTPAHKDAPSSPLPRTATDAIAEPTASHAGAKRKLSDVEESADEDVQVADDQAKKQKTSPQLPQLSPAIWQRIFYLLPPAMLCRCLRVCKDFNRFLTEMKAPQAPQKDKSTARVVDSEAIWIQSRKTYFPQLPRPLRQHSELDMLQLVGGQACQFCGKLPSPVPATSVFNCGPGTDGVRVIFPFAVRTCGACIEPLLRKVGAERNNGESASNCCLGCSASDRLHICTPTAWDRTRLSQRGIPFRNGDCASDTARHTRKSTFLQSVLPAAACGHQAGRRRCSTAGTGRCRRVAQRSVQQRQRRHGRFRSMGEMGGAAPSRRKPRPCAQGV